MPIIVDLSLFKDSKNFCTYFGLLPRIHDLGRMEHHGKMTNNEDRMRRMLRECVTKSHVRNYRCLCPQIDTMMALSTTSRKMLMTAFAS